MSEEQRENLAIHLDSLGLHVAAHAVRARYDELYDRFGREREADCGCTIALLDACEKHAVREQVPA